MTEAPTITNANFDDVKLVGASKIVKTTAYDDLDRVVSETDAEGNTDSYTYDEAGNRITATDPPARRRFMPMTNLTARPIPPIPRATTAQKGMTQPATPFGKPMPRMPPPPASSMR